jgi:phosphodiesterase/alkaline phosphatase D-like protein
MADLLWWLGHATESTASVCVRSDTNGVITIACNGSSYTQSADTSVTDGNIIIDITGLSSDSSYPITITHADTTTTSGNVNTFPSGSHTIGWGSCSKENRHWIAGYTITNVNDICAWVDLGDLLYSTSQGTWYGETSANANNDHSTANLYAHQRMNRRNPGRLLLGHTIPFYYMADDHEWHGNDWDHTIVQANENAAADPDQATVDAAWHTENLAVIAYSKGNPSNSDTDAIATKPSESNESDASNYPVRYFRFTIGNAEYFVLDCITSRSPAIDVDSASKTMLGAQQKLWLKNQLKASSATFKVILSPKKTFKTATADNPDTWEGGYAGNPGYILERDEILSQIHAGTDWTVPGGVIWLAADRHTPEISAAYASNGDLYDHVCITGCPTGVDINTGHGTHGDNTILLAPHYKQVIGVLNVTTDYIEPQLRSVLTGNILWSGRINAGENKLTYPELQVSI